MPTTNFKIGDIVYNPNNIIVRTKTATHTIPSDSVMRIIEVLPCNTYGSYRVQDHNKQIYTVFEREIVLINDNYILEYIVHNSRDRETPFWMAFAVAKTLYSKGYINTAQAHMELTNVFAEAPEGWEEL